MLRAAFGAALAALCASSAFAAPPPRPLPEEEAQGIYSVDGACAVGGRQAALSVPQIEPDPRMPEGVGREARETVNRARASLLRARRALDRMQDGALTLVTATNQCGGGLWDRLAVLTSTGEAAVREEIEPRLRYFAAAGRLTWKDQPLAALEAEAAAQKPAGAARFSGACRAPEPDADLYAPSAPGLPAAAQAKLAAVADAAARVSGALRAQKRALDELLLLTGGRRCRELLSAFDDLARAERQAFFNYREQAVAGAVWGELKWEKVPPR